MSSRNTAVMLGVAMLLSASAQSYAAQPGSNRSFDQEVVIFTDHVQKAEEAGHITLAQANKLKNREEHIVAKVDALRDDNHGEIKTKDAMTMRRKLSALDLELSGIKCQKKYK